MSKETKHQVCFIFLFQKRGEILFLQCCEDYDLNLFYWELNVRS